MTDTAHVPELFALDAERVQAIRDLGGRLALRLASAGADPDTRLLAECRAAVDDLLADRDSLVKANGEAAEELALWTGSV
ncbi:hypothetical protein PV726_32550 [Streptomyces europaeiscabiei]|uniref:hypothetical protein n=1 Tax=Streptomyces europaeiscabiei TaxID=146819 RepID=UPI0029A7D5E3|nr:hypothetical protein [Streptomyces europaeiscabiei]MDX3694989.1 hypothetical protein [Streptomyces europaeiscabiei]